MTLPFDPTFKPELTPQEMLELGVFGGAYFPGGSPDLPKEWFVKARLSPDGKMHKELNYFGVNASQPLSVWQEKGWIHPQDSKGWFQWYCRYYLGRRSEDDARQIKRWRAYRRHAVQVSRNCLRGDFECRPKQRQSLLHWAYDSRRL
ncbi:MAG: hypothetical protein O2840_04400 [bacterium]|nr:hypothetical protein [bacterium]